MCASARPRSSRSTLSDEQRSSRNDQRTEKKKQTPLLLDRISRAEIPRDRSSRRAKYSPRVPNEAAIVVRERFSGIFASITREPIESTRERSKFLERGSFRVSKAFSSGKIVRASTVRFDTRKKTLGTRSTNEDEKRHGYPSDLASASKRFEIRIRSTVRRNVRSPLRLEAKTGDTEETIHSHCQNGEGNGRSFASRVRCADRSCRAIVESTAVFINPHSGNPRE